MVGWRNCFSHADNQTPFQQLNEWFRRRIGIRLWKQWKKLKNKVKRLITLGIPKEKACERGNTHKNIGKSHESSRHGDPRPPDPSHKACDFITSGKTSRQLVSDSLSPDIKPITFR
ncbi:group II intron maturase-specific domain-containing protein [Thermoactinomyces mirandus]|uniref:Group II intron maturase-specific domain-containing protein n=1 Tax=Thermoactinomyces mirandus TaxID=2756294 RepID=A0A7W2AQQ7_9BACL|nr:hypothetical protein [Thermoactinomyces mirandus]